MKTNSPKCYQCGSELILVKRVTEKTEGSHFPQTLTIYRCSNISCQEEKDRQEEKRIKLKEEKEAEKERRVKARKNGHLK
ncbi:MAG: hypothetical protein A2W22_04450 [Candidatus Levybacteria bacterium RBG_16_35_11]|nr:MAG: hypothetical protein A2W22_04450 [Candidatus Levybacteria bacterium RBG_16_35_11]